MKRNNALALAALLAASLPPVGRALISPAPAFSSMSAQQLVDTTTPRPNPELLTGRWTARWIAVPGAPKQDFGVYHFRRGFDLAAQPGRFVVHVTADNRYQLYVNGHRVAWGPARGDLKHWPYESVDLAPYLKAGRNVLAAVVWNYGEHAPMAQVTAETGFLLQGDTAAERMADTGPSWKCVRNDSLTPLPKTHGEMRGYFVMGPGEQWDGNRMPWGWERPEFDDSRWVPASASTPGAARESSDSPNPWMLVPRPIPMMEETPERLGAVRRADGIALPAGFPREPREVTIPPRTKASFLLDQGVLTTG
jgi:hypothetical protein